MDKNERLKLLESGETGKALRTLAFPAIIAMLINAVYNVVDTMFIGLLEDTAAIGAAAVLFPVFLLIGAIGLTFGTGAGSAISRSLGKGDAENARNTSATAFYTSLAVGLVFAVTGAVFIEPVLRLFGATDSMMDRAVTYGRIIIGGSTFQVVNMCMNNMLRAEGAASYSGRALIIGGVLNMLLDPLFMFVFRMGLAGAAAATIVSQAVSTLYLLMFFFRKKGVISIHPAHIRLSAAIYKGIMAIGLPTFGRQVLTSASMAMFNNAAGAYGDAAVASIGIVLRLVSIIMMVMFGIGQGLQPLAGYNYGACRYDRVLAAVRKAVIWSSLFALAVSSLYTIFAGSMIRIFSRDPDVIEDGTRMLRYFCMFLPLIGFQNTMGILFQALGKGLKAGAIALSRQGLFFIPAVLLLPRLFGLNGIMFVQPVADILSVLVVIPLAVSEIRLLRSGCIIVPDSSVAERA